MVDTTSDIGAARDAVLYQVNGVGELQMTFEARNCTDGQGA
jgi:hypothetical protein